MHVKRFLEAKPYDAPNHRGVIGLRLQGFEDGGPENQWIGFSQFLPGGGAGPDATPFDKGYVVTEGEMTITVDGIDIIIGPMDSCTIPAGEVRILENRTNNVVKMIVVIPYPDGGHS